MTDDASTTFDDEVIADMRANGGAVTVGPLAGHPLLVMTSQGVKSGEPRRAILTYSRDGDDYIVAGTAGGSSSDPAWLHNVRADPDVSIEVATQTFAATAMAVVDGPERDRLWEQHVAALPWFAPYPEQTGRVIPMVRLSTV
ncbi:MAG: nitroreductase/quinone reductase family protein [Candidatus Limnocylindrales bacterium]